MGALFGTVNTDALDCGTHFVHGATFSLFVRFRPMTSNSNTRLLVRLGDRVNVSAQIFLSTSNSVQANYTGQGVPTWTGPLGVGTLHSVLATYDGVAMRLYGDTDPTQKDAFVSTVAVPYSATTGIYIGNIESGGLLPAESRIYAVAWWANVALTGAQSAQLGAGVSPLRLGVPPNNYWMLQQDARARVGGAHGAVVGGVKFVESYWRARAAEDRATAPTRVPTAARFAGV
jgi:hypothetical protein